MPFFPWKFNLYKYVSIYQSESSFLNLRVLKSNFLITSDFRETFSENEECLGGGAQWESACLACMSQAPVFNPQLQKQISNKRHGAPRLQAHRGIAMFSQIITSSSRCQSQTVTGPYSRSATLPRRHGIPVFVQVAEEQTEEHSKARQAVPLQFQGGPRLWGSSAHDQKALLPGALKLRKGDLNRDCFTFIASGSGFTWVLFLELQ